MKMRTITAFNRRFPKFATCALDFQLRRAGENSNAARYRRITRVVRKEFCVRRGVGIDSLFRWCANARSIRDENPISLDPVRSAGSVSPRPRLARDYHWNRTRSFEMATTTPLRVAAVPGNRARFDPITLSLRGRMLPRWNREPLWTFKFESEMKLEECT